MCRKQMFKEHTTTTVAEADKADAPNFCEICGAVVDKDGLHNNCTGCGMKYDRL